MKGSFWLRHARWIGLDSHESTISQKSAKKFQYHNRHPRSCPLLRQRSMVLPN
jgi:hypothetical protein